MTVRGTLGQQGSQGPVGPPGTASVVIAPLTGAAVELADDTQILILNPAGTIASCSIDLSAAPTDGQIIEISSTQTITVLTVTAAAAISGAGAITITPLIGLSWRYNAALTRWVRRAG